MKITMVVLGRICLLIWIFCAPVLADEWNVSTGGKPGRYGLSLDNGPDTPTILWQGGVSAVVAHPAVINDSIIAMDRITDIGNVLHGTRIVTQRLFTGETLWTADLPVDFPSTDWRNRVSGMRDGRVYATRAGNTNASYLYCLAASNGAMLWKSDSLVDESSTEGVSFLDNGDLIVGNFANIMRINAQDGNTVWKVQRYSPTSGGSEVAVYGNKGYAWEQSGSGPIISVYNLVTGAKLYSSASVSGGLVQQVAPFVGPDGTVFAPRTQNNAATDYLVAYNDNGAALVEKWRVPLGYVPFASFGIGPDSTVYSYSPFLEIWRIDPQTGAVIDTSAAMAYNFPAQPRMAIDRRGVVYVTNGSFSSGRFYSCNPDLSARWSTPITNVNIGGPAISNGVLIVCGVGTDVRAYYTGISVAENSQLAVPADLDIEIFPNPCHDQVCIKPAEPLNDAGEVRVRIYDTAGRLVCLNGSASLVANQDGFVWSCRDRQGREVPGGVYMISLDSGKKAASGTVTVLR